MRAEPGALASAFRPQPREIPRELSNAAVSFSHCYLPRGRKMPRAKEQTQLLGVPQSAVPPKPSLSPHLPCLALPPHVRWQPVSGRYLFLHYWLALFYLLSKPSSIYSLASTLVVYISLLCLLCHLLKWELKVFGPLQPFPYINLNHTRCGPLLQRKTNWFRQSQYAYCFLTQINTVVWGVWGFLVLVFFFSLPGEPKVIQLKDSRKCD